MKKYLLLGTLSVLYFIGCSASGSLEELKIIPRSDWKAETPKPYNTHIPIRITIHHDASNFDPTKKTAAEHIRNTQVWGMGKDRNWTDIPYHYLIDNEGNIFEGRNVFTVGETATTYDPTGHLLISCIGNFDENDIPEPQLNALISMVAYSSKTFNIPLDSLGGHRDYAQTACPGKFIYKYLQNGELKKRAEDLLK